MISLTQKRGCHARTCCSLGLRQRIGAESRMGLGCCRSRDDLGERTRDELRLTRSHQGAAALGAEGRARRLRREGAETGAAAIAVVARWFATLAHPSPR